MCLYYIDAFVCVTTTDDEVREERRNPQVKGHAPTHRDSDRDTIHVTHTQSYKLYCGIIL